MAIWICHTQQPLIYSVGVYSGYVIGASYLFICVTSHFMLLVSDFFVILAIQNNTNMLHPQPSDNNKLEVKQIIIVSNVTLTNIVL